MVKPVINMVMRKILIINKEKSRKEIIYDVVSEAKEHGYKRDNVLKRCLMGIINHTEIDFNRILRKIISQELPEIEEIMIMNAEKFERYL